MGDFNNYKLFKNVGIRSSDNKLIVNNTDKINNLVFYSSDGGTDNVDIMSINSIINRNQIGDLNLSSLNGNTINPVITINNTHNDCRIKTNLNVEGNLNINKIAINGSLGNSGEVLKSTGNGLEWGTGGTAIDLSSSTGIGTKLISGDQLILGNSPVSLNLNFSGINLHINGNIPTTAGQVLKTNANNDGFEWGAGLADVSGETDFGSKATKMVTVGNNNVGLNLNFSGNNLHINGNVPKAGQVLISNGSEIKWADTDYTLVSNQVIKIVTETASNAIFNSLENILDLSSNNSYQQTYIAHDGYTINEETKKIIIIFNFAVFDSNLVSKIKLEVLIGTDIKKTVIFKNMTGNQINDIVKYFTLTSTEYGTGSQAIKFRFTDMNNTGTIKIFKEDILGLKQPTITLQEIGDQNIKKIINEHGSKSDQIAKVLVNTNSNVTTTQLLDTPYTYQLHGNYTPSVSDTGTIIIIVNFALYISFNNNITSEVKLELLINNNTDPQRTIILQEMFSNRSYEYTKYFSISKTAFTNASTIHLRFTDINNLGNITLFTNDNSPNPVVKQPTVTIQEIGSTTGWGTTIENIPIGQITSADASFNKVVIKNNLDVSGNLNINKIAINGSLGNSGEVLKSTGNGLEWGTGGTAIDLSSSTGIGTKLISGDQLILGNSPVGLNLNFSGNNLHINGNVPKAGQVLVGTGSEIKWANTDNSLINNQLIKVVTETASDGIFKKVQNILHLNSGVPNYTETYTVHDGYILNQETQKIIIIVNFALYINFNSNLTSQVKVELLINNNTEPQRTIILEEMASNGSYEYTKYFSVNSSVFTGATPIHLRFTDMNNSGNIKLFTNNNSTNSAIKQPTITLQEIGDRTVKAILDETRGSKSDQIAKVLVNTNVTTTQLLDISKSYTHTQLLYGDYIPSVSDTGTIIIIVNFALHISFNVNLTSKVKLELLINNNTDSQRTIILQEMSSNRSYEYTKYFSISRTAFTGTSQIYLKFTDMNNSGNIRLFTNDNSTNPVVKHPTVTIQEIGSTTGWGSAINDIPIGQTTSADGSFNKMVVKHNLDVSGNLNVSGNINLTNGSITTTGIENIPIGQTTSADGSFNKMVVKHNLDVSGNLNINSPAYVNVGSTNNAVRIIGSGYGDGSVGISWYKDETDALNEGTQKAYIQVGTDSEETNTNGNLYLNSSNDIILSGGNVGIGTNIIYDGQKPDGFTNAPKNLVVNGCISNNYQLKFEFGPFENNIWQEGGQNAELGRKKYYPYINYGHSAPTQNQVDMVVRSFISMPAVKHHSGEDGAAQFSDWNGTHYVDDEVRWFLGTSADQDSYTRFVFGTSTHQYTTSGTPPPPMRFVGYLQSGYHSTSSYNTGDEMNFTGQHRCVPQNIDFYNNIDNYVGLIVYATGDYKTYSNSQEKLTTDKEAITINDSLPIIDLSNKKKQKSVFGIISNKEEEERTYRAGNFCTPYPNINDDKRLYINSVGEGAIWIVNTNGNLENGDYIQASDVIGMGEKQDDDILHNYTVAKITCDCNFDTSSTKYNCVEFVDPTSGNTYKKAFLGCSYHCG